MSTAAAHSPPSFVDRIPNPPAPTMWHDRLRNEPFRIFFPLGFLLGFAGVSHWVLLSTGVLGRYLAAFHATTQMQSFMLAFASGFLLTAVPKRTRSQPATWAEIALLVVLLPSIAVTALVGAAVLSQLLYAGVLLVLVQFAVRRLAGRAAGRRPPASFILVPLGLVSGFAGSILLAVSDLVPIPDSAYAFGRALVLEGVFLCLALGIGPFFLSLALHGEAPADISRRAVRSIAGYAAAGGLLLASLALYAGGFVRTGLLIRGGVALAVLWAGGAWRRPSRPGRNRQLLLLSTWMIPLGLLCAALFPEHRVAAMHVTFIGGFGLLAFAVATHVTLGHSGYEKEQAGRPGAVLAFGALVAVAMLIRSLGTVLSTSYFEVLGCTAATWLAGATVWAVYLLPKMWRPPVANEAEPRP